MSSDLFITPLKEYYFDNDICDSLKIVTDDIDQTVINNDLVIGVDKFLEMLSIDQDLGCFCYLSSYPWYSAHLFRRLIQQKESFMTLQMFRTLKNKISSLYDAFLAPNSLEDVLTLSSNGKTFKLNDYFLKERRFKLCHINGDLYHILKDTEKGVDSKGKLRIVKSLTQEERFLSSIVKLDKEAYKQFITTSDDYKIEYARELMLFLCPAYELCTKGIFNFGDSILFKTYEPKFRYRTITSHDLDSIYNMVNVVFSSNVENFFPVESNTNLIEEFYDIYMSSRYSPAQ